MNGPGDIPLTLASTPETKPCSLISIIPALGMSSCRGRAEAFARRLSSKLRTLGSQTDDDATSPEEEPIINGTTTNTWMTSHESEQTVTDLQPLRHESDSFFDFDCELESPGSPVDECEYLRLIETASNTPHNSVAESGYVCASAASSQSSSDGPYFDVENTENSNTIMPLTRTMLSATELPEYVDSLQMNGSDERLPNEFHEEIESECELETTEQNSTHDVVDSSLTIETTKQLPTTGPDDELKSPIVANLEPEMSTKEMKKVQEQIICELQKQSECFVVASTQTTENGHFNGLDIEEGAPTYEETGTEKEKVKDEVKVKVEVEAPTELPDSTAVLEVVHSLINGHSEEEGEMLQIELTEIDSKLVQPESNEQVPESPLLLVQPESNEQVPGSPLLQTEVSNESKLKIESCVDTSNAITTTTQVKPASTQRLSGLDTTDDEDDCRPQRVRRCSSLKTGKTPPGTPGRKKIVRFADVLGLDLADVKTFLDEIPTIPKSAFEDLEFMESEPPIQLGPKSNKLLMPLFQQPGGMTKFLDLVREKQVSLENAAVTDHINQTITGSVRVRNLDFNKSVHIRYTLDGWRSYADLQGNYVPNSCDGFSDTFSFVLFGNSLHIGQRLEFAVRFQCKGQQFWDNNYGTNYCFQCLPTTGPIANPIILPVVQCLQRNTNHMVELLSPSAGDAWCTSFY